MNWIPYITKYRFSGIEIKETGYSLYICVEAKFMVIKVGMNKMS